MTTFKREEGFARKFALEEEAKFRAEARRNKLLGLWAAEKLGLTGVRGGRLRQIGGAGGHGGSRGRGCLP